MNKICIKFIESYQKNKNPYSKRCRYVPSCSNYAKECYEKFNFFKASTLSLWRLLRCNPFSKGGFDPVPLTRQEKKEKKELEQREKPIDATIKTIK